jgi:hypothetical protein
MTTGKIDRSAVISQLNRISQTQTPAAPAKVEDVAVKPQGPENLFGDRSKLLDQNSGEGKAVAMTASASALWGQMAVKTSKPPLSVMTLKNLTPDQAKTKLVELEKKQEDVAGRIAGRADELDHKWRYMRLTKRTEALKAYLAETPNLPPEKRAELETQLKSSEACEAKIDGLQAEVKDLKPQPGTTKPGTPEERTALAHQILAARREHSACVKEATATVDDAGLKIERLALTENAIDPSGGQTSPYGSMMGLVGQYFQITFQMNTIQNLYFGPMASMVKELNHESADAKKRDAIEDDWRQRDVFMKDMLQKLSQQEIRQKAQVAKQPIDAIKSRNVGKMSVGELNKLNAKKA